MQNDETKNLFPEEDENPVNEETTQETKDGDEEKQKKNSISADLIRGHINTIILRSLYEGDRYGYDIISEIEQKSHGQYTLKQPTLYSALKRLESQGYVKSYWGGVSNGGRRRYFSLTDEGREIAEKNQAEWEYSRTIIDSLISENDFDFSKPAPEKLDFRILRQATSRTPIISEAEEEPYSAVILSAEQSSAMDSARETIGENGMHAPDSQTVISHSSQNETKNFVPAEETIIQTAPSAASPSKPAPAPQEPKNVQTQGEPASSTPSINEQQSQQDSSATAEKNRTISLFITRKEEERNYKDIVERIYRSGIKKEKPIVYEPTDSTHANSSAESGEPVAPEEKNVSERKKQTAEVPARNDLREYADEEPTVKYNEPKRPVAHGKIDFEDIEELARYDGLRVWTAGGATAKKEMPENFFNKGFALFRAGLAFFAAALLETLLTFIFRDALNVGIRYLVIMSIFSCIPPIVCTALYLAKYQPCCKRMKNNSSVYNGVIAFIASFILLVAADLILNVNLTNGMAVIKYIVIPFIYLLNIVIFSVVYYFLSKSKL